MEPAHIPKLPKEDQKKSSVSFIEFIEKNEVEWEPEKKLEVSNEEKKNYDDWFKMF